MKWGVLLLSIAATVFVAQVYLLVLRNIDDLAWFAGTVITDAGIVLTLSVAFIAGAKCISLGRRIAVLVLVVLFAVTLTGLGGLVIRSTYDVDRYFGILALAHLFAAGVIMGCYFMIRDTQTRLRKYVATPGASSDGTCSEW